MPRVEMIESRDQASPEQVDTFDFIVASRGKMLRPFAALLHRPEIARCAAELGGVIRYQGVLSDAIRELAICTVAIERRCNFEWSAHRPLAEEAGVEVKTLEEVSSGDGITNFADAELVEFARSMCRTGGMTDEMFAAVKNRLGEPGLVELVATISYYTMIAMVLSACDAC